MKTGLWGAPKRESINFMSLTDTEGGGSLPKCPLLRGGGAWRLAGVKGPQEGHEGWSLPISCFLQAKWQCRNVCHPMASDGMRVGGADCSTNQWHREHLSHKAHCGRCCYRLASLTLCEKSEDDDSRSHPSPSRLSWEVTGSRWGLPTTSLSTWENVTMHLRISPWERERESNTRTYIRENADTWARPGFKTDMIKIPSETEKGFLSVKYRQKIKIADMRTHQVRSVRNKNIWLLQFKNNYEKNARKNNYEKNYNSLTKRYIFYHIAEFSHRHTFSNQKSRLDRYILPTCIIL